jgi:hypothetical protein
MGGRRTYKSGPPELTRTTIFSFTTVIVTPTHVVNG